ncbi:MAG: peptidylprolyl isomerase [Clostridia bacterium]|nr:peptidylprolyl isomerase [Clostridia bacterium]
MKRFTRLLSVLLALVIMTCSFALSEAAQTAAENTDPVVLTFGGTDIFQSEIQTYANQLYRMGYTNDSSDYVTAISYVITYVVLPELKAEEHGIENLLGDRYEAVLAEAEQKFDEEMDYYIRSSKGSEISDEEYEKAYQEALVYFAELDFSKEEYIKDYAVSEAFIVLIEGIDVDVSEETILALYDEYVEYDRSFFENDAAGYEQYTQYYNYDILFKPHGYRAITHILLSADEALLASYKDAADEEAKKKAADDIIASRQDVIDEIYARFEAGEEFEALIGEYNTDPGMAGAALKNGYEVHKDSVIFVPEFVTGAFAEEMQEVGDISKPVVTDYGIHILYYLGDIPGGAKEITEAIYEEIKASIIYEAQNKQISEWLDEYEIIYTDTYYQLTGIENPAAVPEAEETEEAAAEEEAAEETVTEEAEEAAE